MRDVPGIEGRMDSEAKEFLERVEARILEKLSDVRRLPSALTRRRAAAELSISLSKLKQWIRKGVLVTCEDPKLIPSSEVLRLAKPAERPLARRTHGRGRPSTYDAAAEAEKIRAGVRARKKR